MSSEFPPRSSPAGMPTSNPGEFSHDGPVLITRADTSFEQQHNARVRRYMLLMSIRIPLLLLAGLVFFLTDNGWYALAVMAVSIPIPWVAVLIANDRPPRKKEEPRLYAGARMPPRSTPVQPQIVGDKNVVDSDSEEP